jgi:hypothetical protein
MHRPRRRTAALVAASASVVVGIVTSAPRPPSDTTIGDSARISMARTAAARSTTSPTTTTTATTTTTTTTIPTATTTSSPPSTTPPVGDPEPDDLLQRSQDAISSAVPPPWLADVAPRLEIIGGVTSWSSTDGSIRVARYHAAGPYPRLRSVLAHEWGHQAAFRYGTREYLGAPPAGWPYSGPRPAETWADCVAQTLTDVNPGRRPGECSEDALQFIRDWLARGPAR